MFKDTNLDQSYMRQAMAMDLLSAEEELELAQKWRDNGDEKALHTLTSAYIKLVISIATRFKRYGLPLSDLVQEGNVGLMQAAARFEPERGFRFSTYANWWIRSSIQEYVLRNWSIVRAGATVAHKSLFFSMRRLKARIEDFDESLSPEARRYIAKELNVREVDVEHMAGRLSGADRSLNAPLKAAEGSTSWQDILPDDDRYTPEMEVMNVRDDRTRSELIAESLKVLNERELHIVRARKLSEENQTLLQIGADLGISKERVRQIEANALKKLKAEMNRLTDGNFEDFGLT